ncbi:hypothetical protein B0H67DRAFT_555560 [Lasiosphaeris hirsuta]|uniref:TM7S3/TM198-like domain-containing protein n=1 Tax=Lasiosphaeris hirsuta TaxID=260670 RepID=A0AA40DPT0_9PEZI|nr:hypothetical protein B0H67DRAFT_555560 [Lasiosphaeris hirsuta]
MRISEHSLAGAFLYLCLILNLAAARLEPIRRQETGQLTTSPARTSIDNGQKTVTSSISQTTTTDESGTRTTTTPSSSRSLTSPSPIPTTTSNLDATLFSNPIPEGQLPLEPRITPGWAVAGVILLGTGVVYALVGIKTKWLHTFLSTAFLTSLGTSVLIIYVMITPVSDAIQGAYVVAAVCTGLVLGGLAIVFKEVTECLGCLLGGFCLSMWILALQPGGLITNVGGKVVFIASFTLATFFLYFTKWTRTYGLIVCISFSGATVAVLGIDCFSRAGLKEFWAYIWALNDNLFPLGADTYPLTRGIRVELAVTILIFLSGIVSQLKLWRIIKEHRKKRNAALAEGERNLRAEEENVGRRVEESTTRERREWERIYGDGGLADSSDSGVGDMESEKRSRHSKSASATMTTRAQSPAETDLGMGEVDSPAGRAATPLSLTKAIAAAEVAMSKRVEDGGIIVRVGEDDSPAEIPLEERFARQEKDTDTSSGREQTRASSAMPLSRRRSNSPGQMLTVVPLPFKIPESRNDDDRSSVATFADEDTDSKTPVRRSRSETLTRKLSKSSGMVLRSLSQHSTKNRTERDETFGESREDLAESRCLTRGDSDSVRAHLDDLSSNSDMESLKDGDAPPRLELRVSTDLSIIDGNEQSQSPSPEKGGISALTASNVAEDRMLSVDSGSPGLLNGIELSQFIMPTLDASTNAEVMAGEGGQSLSTPEEVSSAKKRGDKSSKRPKSTASVDSLPASLKRGNLPPALSRVALSYRTNEWAKHLSAAEAPQLDFPLFHENPEFDTLTIPEEPAPLDVIELQQTAQSAALPPAAPRSASMMPSHQQAVSRSSSMASLSGYQDAAGFGPLGASASVQLRNGSVPYRSVSGTLKGRSSTLFDQPIAEEGDGGHMPMHMPGDGNVSMMHSSSTPHELSASTSPPTLWPNSPPVSYGSSQTLMGMREMILRNKASHGLFVTQPADIMPTIASRPSSDAGSLHSYPIYPSSPSNAQQQQQQSPSPLDMDDLPLSQRRVMMRQSNLTSSAAAHTTKKQPSRSSLRTTATAVPPITPATAETAAFDSHQPLRHSTAPPEAVRQAQLASFRNSIAADLRAGTPPVLPVPVQNAAGAGGLVALAANAGAPGPPATAAVAAVLGGSVSMSSLRGAYAGAELHRTIERQRSFMLGQKEVEVMRREVGRVELEGRQREFDERMRSGAMMEAHRDAMRRMQGGVRDL